MTWGKLSRGSAVIWCMLAAALLAGCASSPSQDPEAAAKQEQKAREAELRSDYSQAVALLRGGDTDNARALLESIHRDHPEHTGPLANLGIIALKHDDTDTAQTYFRQVLERDPAHSVALTHLGVIARQQGEFDKSESLYRRALEADPEHLPAILNLAILLDIYLGRLEEALPLYEQYQSSAEEPNPRLKDWIFDVKNRL